MADLVNLRAAYALIRFLNEAADALVAQGINGVAVLAMLSEKDTDNMLKHMNHWRTPTPGGGVAPVPVMPYLSVLELKVMYECVLECERLGLNLGV
jgi:hypothetical protein